MGTINSNLALTFSLHLLIENGAKTGGMDRTHVIGLTNQALTDCAEAHCQQEETLGYFTKIIRRNVWVQHYFRKDSSHANGLQIFTE